MDRPGRLRRILRAGTGRSRPCGRHVEPARVERLFRDAGFRETRVMHEIRETAFPSFDDYWAPIEGATGVMPQAYRSFGHGG